MFFTKIYIKIIFFKNLFSISTHQNNIKIYKKLILNKKKYSFALNTRLGGLPN